MRLFVVATSLLTVNTFNDVGGVVWTQRADDTKLWMPPAWKNRLNRTRAQEAAQRAQPPRVPLRAVQHQLRRLLCHLRVGGYRHCPSSNSTELVTCDDGACGGENSTVELVDLYEEEVSAHTNWTLTLLLAAALALALSRSAAGRRLLAAWAKRGSEREAALAESLRVVQRQLELLESQNLESEAEIERCRGLLSKRAGLFAPLLLTSQRGASAEARLALHERKLAELLSLLLDVLNWKLGQGSALSRAQFWEAFGCCEAMMRDLAAGEEAAAACVRQLHRLALQFELVRVGVPLQWRWRDATEVGSPQQAELADHVAACARRGSDVDDDDAAAEGPKKLLSLNREVPLHTLLAAARPASEFGLSQECAWLVPAESVEAAEAVLHATRRRLRRAAKSDGSTSARGISVEEVRRARDQVNAMLRKYSAPVEMESHQEPEVAAWLGEMREAAARPTLTVRLSNWDSAADDADELPFGFLSPAEAPSPRGAGTPVVE
jgi:hypothetical protein